MQCKNPIKVKSKNPYGLKYCFIPCGHCEECRKAKKNEWTIRLNGEIEEYHTKMGYKIGFLTLTYNDQHLPHIPKTYLKNPNDKIPCFSYQDIKKFTDTIRTYLWRERKLTDGFRYFITSEYGEKYHRPHYHGIIIYHPSITALDMYQICTDAWCGTTELIKNNKKRKTKRQNLGIIAPFETFVPRDNYACGAYVAKYVCKDIEFTNYTSDKIKQLTKKQRNHLRHFQPFHKQSLGFGACLIKNKSEKELLNMINDGVQFTGNPKMLELPVYLKNKILFDTQKLYNLNTHKFETIKKYTKFFHDNKDAIYEKKLKTNEKIIEQFKQKEFWDTHKIIDDNQTNNAKTWCSEIIDTIGTTNIAGFYTLYYGVEYEQCKYFANPADGLFARYNPCADLEHLATIDRDYYIKMNNIISMLIGYRHLVETTTRNERQQLIDEIKAFWNNHK